MYVGFVLVPRRLDHNGSLLRIIAAATFTIRRCASQHEINESHHVVKFRIVVRSVHCRPRMGGLCRAGPSCIR